MKSGSVPSPSAPDVPGSWTPPPGDTPLIIDTDLGDDPDDAVALAIAARSEANLALVVTSDERAGARARFARQFLDLLGRPDVAVVAGAQVQPDGPGLCVRDLIDPGVGRQPDDVASAVQSVVDQARGPVRWLGLGFLTNLAQVCEQRSDLAARLVVTQMGGAFDLRPRRPEHNFGGDPAAARRVLTRLPSPTFLLADFTFHDAIRVMPDSGFCALLDEAPAGTWKRLLGDHFRAWFALSKRSFLHDPLAFSVSAGHPFVRFDAARVSVDATGYLARAAAGDPVWLSTAVDYASFVGYLLGGLDLPPEESGLPERVQPSAGRE